MRCASSLISNGNGISLFEFIIGQPTFFNKVRGVNRIILLSIDSIDPITFHFPLSAVWQ